MLPAIRYARAVPRAASSAYKPFFINTRSFSATAVTLTKISKSIKHDHQELEKYYNNIKNSTTDEEKIAWRNQFTWELARHAIGEELVVYPAFEKLLPNGKELADKDRRQHLEVKAYLQTFQNLEPEHVDFHKTLEALWTELSQHIEEEEIEDLPALEKALDETESKSMSKSFGRTKMFTPTRPHPNAPDKPPFETVFGLLAAPIDRLRDLFRKFPDETKS
ncbi:HHE domain protein [Xylariaceae sp. AK1471]|nr:HHE domain protein [Xylariaceae sp. AK1471]